MKYSLYKGTVGKIASNIIRRDFNSNNPNKKCYTDVIEFNHIDNKINLSIIKLIIHSDQG